MLSIKIQKYLFKPSIIASMVTLFLLYVMVSLGLWQLDRAEYKANLQSLIDDRKSEFTVPLEKISLSDDDWKYQRVDATGEYDSAHQVLLDNQVNNTIAGYKVFTPLLISTTKAILVDRGWVAQGTDRSQLPDLAIDKTDVTINGVLAPLPAKGLVLSDNANTYSSWPAVLQYIDTVEIASEVKYTLLPAILTIDDKSRTIYEVVPFRISMSSEKHTAYAFQWFALSFTLLIIYFVTNTKRIKSENT